MLTLEKAEEMVNDAKERSESENVTTITVVPASSDVSNETQNTTPKVIPAGVSTEADGLRPGERVSSLEGDLHPMTEVARFLKVSEARIRHWEKTFSEVLSNHRNQYNHRMFTDADVKILERIKFLQDSKLYTKEGITARLNSKLRDKGGVGVVTAAEKQFQQKLLVALNTLATEIKGLRREVREDLKGDLKKELDHLTLLLFPPKQEKKWYQFFKK